MRSRTVGYTMGLPAEHSSLRPTHWRRLGSLVHQGLPSGVGTRELLILAAVGCRGAGCTLLAPSRQNCPAAVVAHSFIFFYILFSFLCLFIFSFGSSYWLKRTGLYFVFICVPLFLFLCMLDFEYYTIICFSVIFFNITQFLNEVYYCSSIKKYDLKRSWPQRSSERSGPRSDQRAGHRGNAYSGSTH